MLKMRSLTGVFAIGSVALLLSACTPTTAQEMMRGKQAYIAHRYDLSSVHVSRAAKEGDPDAQYAMGYMFYYGKGVPQDYKRGKYWIAKAAAQGQPLAIKALKMINQPEKKPVVTTPQPIKVYGTKPKAAHKTVTTKRKVVKLPPHKYVARPVTKTTKRRPYSLAEQALLKLPSSNYTIQLLGSVSPHDVINFIHRYRLTRAAIYKTKHNGVGWYVVVYGNYRTIPAAVKALHRLPMGIKYRKPWVKSLRVVQREIQKGH